jgi:hypothetical protein
MASTGPPTEAAYSGSMMPEGMANTTACVIVFGTTVASPVLAIDQVRHFHPLAGKLFVLPPDFGIARFPCAPVALRGSRSVVVGSW